MPLPLPLWSWFFLLLFLIAVEIPSSSSNGKLLRRRSTKQQKNGFQCTADIKNCIEPVTSKICSGNGACVCGQCACFQTDFETYYGRFCEHCDSCSPNLCHHLNPCVECKVHSTGPYEKQHDCEAHCSRFPEIQIAQVASSDEKDDSYYCTFTDTEGCEFYFVYGYDAAGHLIIIAEKDKECPVKSFAVNQTILTSSPKHTLTSQHSQYPHQQKLTEFHRMKSSSSGHGQTGGGYGSTSTGTTSTKARTRPPPVFTDYKHSHPKISENTNSYMDPNSVDVDVDADVDGNSNSNSNINPISGSASTEDENASGSSSINTVFTPTRSRTPKKILNTPAFDLMIVCGLTLARNSDKTTQQPQYFQRNGIHFDIENCQFIPKNEAFVFSQASPTSTATTTATSQESFEFEMDEQRRQRNVDSDLKSQANSIQIHSFLNLKSHPNGGLISILLVVLSYQILMSSSFMSLSFLDL